ncbi:MAG TPA: double-strand break repair protein AddB [Acetobacteraceae bacterium]|nr:double-strand break repair protein AddB [Acetobacteraceae bacterium]
MRVCTIPAHVPFLDTLAARWLDEQTDNLARGLILLPTRRAARALTGAFLRAGNGQPMLLPRITALGAIDEAPLALAGALDLPPAVAPAERLAVLARMILALPPNAGGVNGADRAWQLARELVSLMDEAERADCDLASRLPDAAEGEHAEHWQITLRFLEIVTRAWPGWLGEQGLMNPAARQAALLRAQALAWRETAPDEPVWAAGMTAGYPAVTELLRAVAQLPQGRVIFPALGLDIDEATWTGLQPGHWQSGLRDILQGLGVRRDEVSTWRAPSAVPGERSAALGRSLLPADALAAWRQPAAVDLGAVTRLTAADEQEEAVAIAMLLRDAIDGESALAALVTPDRALAGRVTAELLRWGVVADDSAGEPLAQSPPAVFLRLLAQAVAQQLAPVALLSVLKHPLAAAGMKPAACRAAARRLDLALRGPKPLAGLPGFRKATEREPVIRDAVERALAPMLRFSNVRLAPREMLLALIEAAEAMARTDEADGASRLWAHEEGEALATLLAEALDPLAHVPDQPPSVLPGLLDALLEGAVVRSRRALRGREERGEHPRVFIWGLLEARLQAVDLVVLGGLVEGVWPSATDPGPWMSREMRARVGLPSPEERVGQEAHDFLATACAAPRVVLSCPRRRDGAPAVQSRFLARLEAWLKGHGAALAADSAGTWAKQLDLPDAPRPVRCPVPRPTAAVRPRRLSVTEIETLLCDPYAIYARHVLRLRPLDPLEQATDYADYGELVHDALQDFFEAIGTDWPANAPELLSKAMDHALQAKLLRPALQEWWAPRLARIAEWVAIEEAERRAPARPVTLRTEVSGKWELDIEGPFLLTGRADRIEKRQDGTVTILDYKTGRVPTGRAVEDGDAPQLPIEAAMTEAGAFGADIAGAASELIYWRLTGGAEPGRAIPLLKSDPTVIAENVADARKKLIALLCRFSRTETAYRSQPHPGRRPRFPDYAHLARCAEWDVREDGE